MPININLHKINILVYVYVLYIYTNVMRLVFLYLLAQIKRFVAVRGILEWQSCERIATVAITDGVTCHRAVSDCVRVSRARARATATAKFTVFFRNLVIQVFNIVCSYIIYIHLCM